MSGNGGKARGWRLPLTLLVYSLVAPLAFLPPLPLALLAIAFGVVCIRDRNLPGLLGSLVVFIFSFLPLFGVWLCLGVGIGEWASLRNSSRTRIQESE